MENIEKTFKQIDCMLFHILSDIAEERHEKAYIIGGFVRDMARGVANDDVDICIVGKGTEFAKEFGRRVKSNVDVYESYGTAKVDYIQGRWKTEVEFVGARKEFYHRETRNPIVEDGTLEDDMARRDFTINDMAISLNKEDYGTLIDPYNGEEDLKHLVIRCVSDPVERFSEDPLRMLRAVRFAARFGCVIEDKTREALKSEADRIKIIVKERVLDELNKMLLSMYPSSGLHHLYESGLMEILLPEVACLAGRDVIDGVGHKDVLQHTLQVVDNASHILNVHDIKDPETRRCVLWAALLHDIGKADTKAFDPVTKAWTFRDHEKVGATKAKRVCQRLGLPINETEKIVKLVRYHMHPMQLCEEGVTDSAIRRFLFEAGSDIDMIMTLVNADLTTRYEEKREAFRARYKQLQERMQEIEEKDAFRNFKLAFTGDDIMKEFHMSPGKTIGEIKEWYKNKVVDGEIPNDFESIKNAIIEHYSYLCSSEKS